MVIVKITEGRNDKIKIIREGEGIIAERVREGESRRERGRRGEREGEEDEEDNEVSDASAGPLDGLLEPRWLR